MSAITMPSSFELADLTFEEAKSVLQQGAMALLPCGSTEAHGPHLPLSTDVLISQKSAVLAAKMLFAENVPSLVLPPIAYAVTEFAAGFSGTLSISEEGARSIVREVCKAAHRAGFELVVLCNAHLEPGQLRVLHDVANELNEAGVAVVFPDITRKPHALLLGDEFRSGACHAGHYETSLALSANESLVRMDIAHALLPNPISLSRAIRDGKSSFQEAGGDRAYFGDPASATKQSGDALHETLARIYIDTARKRHGT